MRRRAVVACLALMTVAAPLAVGSREATAQPPGYAWLALGDSYASGEGISGTVPEQSEASGRAVHGRDCRRATGDGTEATAWSVGAYREVSGELGLSTIALVACTGAATTELVAQAGEARARFGQDQWHLVTLTIGGNDIGFEKVLLGCLDIPASWGDFVGLTPGCDVSERELRDRVDELRGSLSTAFDAISGSVAPGGDVVVLAYPQLVEEVSSWDLWRRVVAKNCEGIEAGDVGMLRSIGGYLNERIALTVQQADARHREDGIRFHFLDVSGNPYERGNQPDERHALCTATPWLNGQTLGLTSGDLRLQRSFHPRQVGHTNTAHVLAAFLRDNVSFQDAPLVDPDQLLAAPVPARCGHEAGRLVDGALPGIPEGRGSLELAFANSEGSDEVAVGDLTGDGESEIAAVFRCDAGGVALSEFIEIYTTGPKQLASIDLSIVPDTVSRLFVWDLSIEDRLLRVRWAVGREDDPACCPSLDVVGDFRVDKTGVSVPVAVNTVDESLAVRSLVDAVRRGSRSDAEQWAAPVVADVLLSLYDGRAFEVAMPCNGILSFRFTDNSQPDGLRACRATVGDTDVWIGFNRVEFGVWIAVDLTFPL